MKESRKQFHEELAESRRAFDKRMEESRRAFDQQMAERRAESDRRRAESDRQRAESEQQMKKLRQQMGDLGLRIGDLVEHMIGGKNVVEQFQDLGYNVTEHSRNITFGELGDRRQIDLLLDDGDVAILIEVKTNLKNDDVLDHIERLKTYRRCKDSKGEGKKRYIGALACAMVEDNVIKFAQKNGMYVIKQLGNTVEIVASPQEFKAKEW